MKNILSIDGGGAKGLIAITMLNETGLQASDFDIIAGTSVGGILACAIDIMPVEEVFTIMKKQIPEIFKNNFWWKTKSLNGTIRAKYDNKNLKNFLEDTFKNSYISTRGKERDILITSYNITKNKPKIWKSSQDNVRVADICMTTSAAPTYFKPYKLFGNEYVDGGVFFNNPILIAIAEAKKLYPDEQLNIVSIGCGIDKHNYNVGNGGLTNWANDIIPLFMTNNTDGLDYFIKLFYPDVNYLRLQPEIDGDIKIDSTDKIDEMIKIGNLEITRKRNELNEIATKIKHKKITWQI